MKISLSQLTYEMSRYLNISLSVSRRGYEQICKGVRLPRDPHKIVGLEICMLLMDYLTQNQFNDDNIKNI